jgi:hypothetical protein
VRQYLQNKSFKVFLSLGLALCLFAFQVVERKYCPVNLDGQILKTLDAAPYAFFGKVYACNGEILQVINWYNNLPYYQLLLDNGGTIWVSGQLTTGFEEKGNKVRVLGYFDKAPPRFKPSKVNPDAYHLLGFAVLNLSNRQIVIKPGKEALAQEWVNGKVPEPEKSKK